MESILDASGGLKFVLNEALADKAWRLRDEHRLQFHELLVPETSLAELLTN